MKGILPGRIAVYSFHGFSVSGLVVMAVPAFGTKESQFSYAVAKNQLRPDFLFDNGAFTSCGQRFENRIGYGAAYQLDGLSHCSDTRSLGPWMVVIGNQANILWIVQIQIS